MICKSQSLDQIVCQHYLSWWLQFCFTILLTNNHSFTLIEGWGWAIQNSTCSRFTWLVGCHHAQNTCFNTWFCPIAKHVTISPSFSTLLRLASYAPLHIFLLISTVCPDAWTPVGDLWRLSFMGQCLHDISVFSKWHNVCIIICVLWLDYDLLDSILLIQSTVYFILNKCWKKIYLNISIT